MKKYLIIFLASLLTVILGVPTTTAADKLVKDPLQLMNDEKPASSARGMLFFENIESGASIGFIRYSHITNFASNGTIKPSDYWDWKRCESWSDSSCPNKDGFTIEGRVVLGLCLNRTELGCVERFQISKKDGTDIKVEYLGPAYSDVMDIPESTNLTIPRSSSPQIFRDKSGQMYVIRAGIRVSRTGRSIGTDKLDVDVTPVVKTADTSINRPQAERNIDPVSKLGNVSVVPSPSYCVAINVGVCYRAIEMAQELKYGVEVRVPSTMSGWLRGRVSNPDFQVVELNSRSLIVKVSAMPAVVPIAGGWIKNSELPPNFLENLYPSANYDSNPQSSYFLVGSPSQGSRGMEEYVAWSPYFKERALMRVTTWSFGTNMSGNDAPCLRGTNSVTGFVATNASVYASNPPEWNSANYTLTYKVGSPHLDETGSENVGTYTLAMPLKTIQCLYNQTTLPPSATVSLSYGSEVVEVATITLKSDSGWVYFSANGFHYSNPTILVKFAKPAGKESSDPASPVNQMKTQWCAKGNLKKKVQAATPVCPSGYRKIPAPSQR